MENTRETWISSRLFRNLRERISSSVNAPCSTSGSTLRPTLKAEPLESRQMLTAVADFSLTDVNPNSSTYGQEVSPRDYLGEASAWYFGHAT